MMTSTDTLMVTGGTLTDRLNTAPSASFPTRLTPTLTRSTTTSNIFADNVSAAYNFSNHFNTKPFMNTDSAPSYDDPSVTDARGDAFEQMLWNYNPGPITDEDEVAVLYIERDDDVTPDNLESLEDFYSSYGKEADITTATIDDDFHDVFDAIYVPDLPVAKYSQKTIKFYENICGLLDDDGVLVATFYSKEELDLVKHILEESEEFEIKEYEASDPVEASYTVTDDYVNSITASLNAAIEMYEAAGVDIEAIINKVKPHVGHTITFEYNKYVLIARKNCTDEYTDGHDEEADESDHDEYGGSHGDEPEDTHGEDESCDEECHGDENEGTESGGGNNSGEGSHGEH